MQPELLEREVAELTHHEPADRVDDQQHEHVLVRVALPVQVVVEQDGRRDDVGGGRNREPDEVPALDRAVLHVEAREPERAAGDVERRREPSPAPPRAQRPGVDQDAGRHAERDQVRERVVLHAEGAGGAGEAGDAAVERVTQLRYEDHDSGQTVVVVQRGDDRVEAREEARRGEQVRQDVDAVAQRRDTSARPALPARIGCDADGSHRTAPAGSSATTVWPARTRSPRATTGRAAGGRKRSTREPNMIIPKRSLRANRSPGWRWQTMRRASAPAICTTRNRPPGVVSRTALRSLSSDALSANAARKRPAV